MEDYKPEGHPPIVTPANTFLQELPAADQVVKLKDAVRYLLRENRELRSHIPDARTP